MKLWEFIRRRLWVKLLISYLVVVVIGVIVLAATATMAAPDALASHMQRMEATMGHNPLLLEEERLSFSTAVNEILSLAAVAAIISAVTVSIFVTRRIAMAIHGMTFASHQIATGNLRVRVSMPDPDELGQLAESFNRMAEHLEETEQTRIELIGNVAHELRTPLSSIRSNIEGLIDGVLPADTDAYIAIQHEIARLQRLVKDLEELSQAEAGQISLDLRSANLQTIIQSVAERLRPQFEEKDVSLGLNLLSEMPLVRIDSARITQVLINLLGNALQYTPTAGGVTVNAQCENGQICVAVRDTGIGLAPEHLQAIFSRFFRVDKSRSRVGGGSGIGLTISKHIVEAHGGRIWACSSGIGLGSTFTFALPTI